MARLNHKQIGLLIKGKKINAICKALCGEMIGKGANREVFVLKQNPNYVVKVEVNPSRGSFANVMEWRNYIDYSYVTGFCNYLAPCELITETGQVLIQRRIEFKKRKDYPKYVPAVFTDLKLQNFGWIGNQFVCCDYSFLLLLGTDHKKMKYAKWWNGIGRDGKPGKQVFIK